jgi:hypothetical protein
MMEAGLNDLPNATKETNAVRIVPQFVGRGGDGGNRVNGEGEEEVKQKRMQRKIK